MTYDEAVERGVEGLWNFRNPTRPLSKQNDGRPIGALKAEYRRSVEAVLAAANFDAYVELAEAVEQPLRWLDCEDEQEHVTTEADGSVVVSILPCGQCWVCNLAAALARIEEQSTPPTVSE